jgi:benzil reductase ((S)-benzoin forming)
MKRLIVVTGCSRGLGKAIIDLALEAPDCLVISLSRSLHLDHQVAGLHIVHLHTDLSAMFDVNVFDKIAAYLTPNIELYFFNNASIITPIQKIGSFSQEEIEESIAVNITYPIKFINLFVAKFKAYPLNIINISSGVATKPLAYWSLYSASKAGLRGFLQTLALENKDIKVHDINPGVIDTDMQKEIRAEKSPNQDYFISLKNENKLLSPKEAAVQLFEIINF